MNLYLESTTLPHLLPRTEIGAGDISRRDCGDRGLSESDTESRTTPRSARVSPKYYVYAADFSMTRLDLVSNLHSRLWLLNALTLCRRSRPS
jgi:hypothetical protein